MKMVEKSAANVKPGKVVNRKRLFVGSFCVVDIMKLMTLWGSVTPVLASCSRSMPKYCLRTK